MPPLAESLQSLPIVAMPPEITALIDKPLLLAAVIFIGVISGVAVERFALGQERAKKRAD